MPSELNLDKSSIGQKVGQTVLLITALVTMGIATFDRSRSTDDSVVITAKAFFPLFVLFAMFVIGSSIKQACTQSTNTDLPKAHFNGLSHPLLQPEGKKSV